MKLQDGSLGSQTTDAEVASSHQVYLKIRAFFLSFAFVNMDQQEHFNLGAAESMNDKILTFLYAHHTSGRPPVTFYTEAWDATARVFQLGVRAGKTLCALTEADSTWQHHWTAYTPPPRSNPSPANANTATNQSRGGKGGKGGGKGGKDGQETLRAVQQKKDRQIAQLKRDLEESQRTAGQRSSTSTSKDGKWKSQKRW